GTGMSNRAAQRGDGGRQALWLARREGEVHERQDLRPRADLHGRRGVDGFVTRHRVAARAVKVRAYAQVAVAEDRLVGSQFTSDGRSWIGIGTEPKRHAG